MDYLFNPILESSRTGKQNRINLDRFFHIMNEGWFVYLRNDPSFVDNLTIKDNIAGPFDTKSNACDFLSQYLNANVEPKNTNMETSNAIDIENWRY